jgi:hypothetical protein
MASLFDDHGLVVVVPKRLIVAIVVPKPLKKSGMVAMFLNNDPAFFSVRRRT